MFRFMAMRSMLAVVWAAVAAHALAADLPVYCRLLQVGLEEATYQPILRNVNLSILEHAPLLGDIDMSIINLEIASVKMIACDASIDGHGLFNVGIQRMAVDLKQLEWRYTQRSWPHEADHGVASGDTSVSFNVSIDVNRSQDHFFEFHLDEINITMGAEQHPFLTPALETAVRYARPLISAALQHELNSVLDQSLDAIRKQGGCAFLQDMLPEIDLAKKFEFVSYDHKRVPVPVLGSLDVSINSTHVTQPTSMQCEHVGFEGQTLTAHIENVAFDAGFNWAYQKPGSSFWQNQGTGNTSVVAGAFVHIDLLQPAATELKIDLPVLKLQLAAESDAWLYKALTRAMIPLVRESLQLFGGKVMGYEIKKCLEDPTCPKLSSRTSYKTLAAESVSIVV